MQNESLSKIARFKKGDKVFCIRDFQIREACIQDVAIEDYIVTYELDNKNRVGMNGVYATYLEAMIAKQHDLIAELLYLNKNIFNQVKLDNQQSNN